MADLGESSPDPALPRRGRAALMVLLAVAIGVAAVVGWRVIQERRAAVSELARATSELEKVDVVVADIDAAVSAPLRSGLETRAADAQSRVSEAVRGLSSVISAAERVSTRLDPERQERARLVGEAARARMEMLDAAPVVLAASIQALKAMPTAESAWARVVKADEISRRAVRSYNKHTRAGVRESKRLNTQAAGELSDARAGLVRAANLLPEAKLAPFVSYVDARIALNKLSQRSDAAWLDGRLADANAAIREYNDKDKRAVEQAKALRSTPVDAIGEAHREAVKEALADYNAARARATAADAKLRVQ